MARWQRAVRLLGLPRGAAVLDVGCAFGYGTARLARRYHTQGIDPSEEYIARARRSYPTLRFAVGTAEALPYADAAFDGVVMLDVLEHLPPGEEGRALGDVARVLQPGGRLVLSTPNRGLLAPLDSLNAYLALRGRAGDATLAATLALRGDPPRHRHYSAAQVGRLLSAHGLVVERVSYSGVGLAEPINLALLLTLWWPRPLRLLYGVLQYAYYGAYIAEDALSIGPLSYHLTVVARRGPNSGGRRGAAAEPPPR